MRNDRNRYVALAGTLILVAVATLASSSPQEGGQELPPIPETPAAIEELISVRPFFIEQPGTHGWRADKPSYSSGYLLVIRVDPALVVSRQTPEPILYVGDQTARRVNEGFQSGFVVVIAPAALEDEGAALEPVPIWFGEPGLPERVTPELIVKERERAERAAIYTLSAEAWAEAGARGGPPLRLESASDLIREAAMLVQEYSPYEKDLISGLLVDTPKEQ